MIEASIKVKSRAAVAFAAAAVLMACSSASKPGGAGGATDTGTSTSATSSHGSTDASSSGSTSGAGGASTSSGTGGHECALYVSTATLTTPTESFSNNVLKIFSENCATSSCHGATPPTGNLALGSTLAEADATYKALVGIASNELTTMQLVKAGSPEESYLMHKMDADQCYYDFQCAGSCGAAMPNLGTSLPVGTRDIVRRWIAQGARNN